MASIDKRVVEMKFDNGDFEKRVSGTLGALGKLKDGLGKLAGATKGLGDFKVPSTGLSPLGHGVDALVTKFSALQVAGVTAIANIANKAVNAGTSIANSLTIAPISGGLGEYEKKLGSIQTILANTGDGWPGRGVAMTWRYEGAAVVQMLIADDRASVFTRTASNQNLGAAWLAWKTI